MGRRARHRPGPGRLLPDHAQGPARSRAPTTSSSWPATRPCWRSGSTGRCARDDIELAGRWFTEHSAVRAFPHALWDSILDAKPGDDIFLPIDVWGFPGGQTFLPGVPCLFFEGPGGVVSLPGAGHVPLLRPGHPGDQGPADEAGHAARRRVRPARSPRRSCPTSSCCWPATSAAAAGSPPTTPPSSSYPELFRSIGTIGHEMMCAAQSFDRSLGEAEYEMMDRFVTRDGHRRRCCATWSMPRRSAWRTPCASYEPIPKRTASASASIPATSPGSASCISEQMQQLGITPRTIVFEDEVTPETVRQVYDHFRQATGEEPTMLFPGAGGYWWRLVHRDTVAAAFKRTATGDHPNVKFSNSPGKESLGGYLRVYGRGDALVVADASEQPAGEPLFVKLVEQGRIVYRESFEEQAAPRRPHLGPLRRVRAIAARCRLAGTLPGDARRRSSGGAAAARRPAIRSRAYHTGLNFRRQLGAVTLRRKDPGTRRQSVLIRKTRDEALNMSISTTGSRFSEKGVCNGGSRERSSTERLCWMIRWACRKGRGWRFCSNPRKSSRRRCENYYLSRPAA